MWILHELGGSVGSCWYAYFDKRCTWWCWGVTTTFQNGTTSFKKVVVLLAHPHLLYSGMLPGLLLALVLGATRSDKSLDNKINEIQPKVVMLAQEMDGKDLRKGNPEPALCAKENYKAADDDEVSFKAGDELQAYKKIDEGWLQGRINGGYGQVPSNYFEPC